MPQKEKVANSPREYTLKLSVNEIGLIYNMLEGAQISGKIAEIYLSLKGKVTAELEKAQIAEQNTARPDIPKAGVQS